MIRFIRQPFLAIILLIMCTSIAHARLPTNFKKIIEAPIVGVEPYGKLNSILNILSNEYENFSDEERKNYINSIKGKYIQWILPVSDIHTNYEGKILIETGGNTDVPSCLIVLSPKDELEIDYLSKFKKGDELEFKGRIETYDEMMSTLIIDPAMIVNK